jgi:hypothetical protein
LPNPPNAVPNIAINNIINIEPFNRNGLANEPVGVVDGDRVGVVEDEDIEIAIDVEEADDNGKKTRRSRKFTFWNFVERIDASTSFCKCGCLDLDGVDRKTYGTPTTGAIKRHVEKVHPALFTMLTNAKNNRGNIMNLLEKIEELDGNAVAKVKKQRRNSDRFWIKSIELKPAVISDLRLLMWSISSGISRNAVNDPLFDAYIRSLGAQVAPNRHTLQDQHLPVLDDLVRTSWVKETKDILSSALSSDGWRDRHRRDWINIVIAFIILSLDGKSWVIRVIEPDLIFLPSSATSDTIAYLINDSVDRIVHFFRINHESLFFAPYLLFSFLRTALRAPAPRTAPRTKLARRFIW